MLSIQLERPQKMAVNDIYATCNGCVCGAGSAGAKSTRQEQKIARALRHVTSISERIWRERKQYLQLKETVNRSVQSGFCPELWGMS